jgi:ParB family chromosome partitioning protein
MMTVQSIPIEKIRVINARSRNKAKFREIVDNIARVGLKKPVTVSRREGEDGYDLVCGQGRLEAYTAYGATEIPAFVLDIPMEDRLLRSLVENLTRRTRTPLEMARDLLVLKERGHTNAEIAQMVGVSEAYVTQLLRLVKNGEERLIAAVERGELPITIAIDIMTADDEALQRSLREAYEAGDLRGKSLLKVRRIVDERRAKGKEIRGGSRSTARKPRGLTAQDLVRTLQRENQRQALLIKKARHCEQQLRFVVSALKDLLKDEGFVTLLRAEKLDTLPKHLNDLIQK